MFVTKCITAYNFIYLCIYFRLSHSEQNIYLKQLLGNSDDDKSLGPSDSDDEDWFPVENPAVDVSDSEENDDKSGEQEGQGQVVAENSDGEIEKEQETQESETESEAEDEARGILICII